MIQNLLLDIWGLMAEMAPYLLLGFLLAGLMHAYIPRQVYAAYLSKSDFRSVLLAALFGVPLPLCSCGVLPTAMSLRREGGSRGATVSFLIATPQTGIDSIFATYSLMGLPFAIIRPLVAFVTAIFGGVLVNRFDPKHESLPCDAEVPDGGCHCDCSQKEVSHPGKEGMGARLRSALHYGFVEMMGDIGKWLIVGLIVAGMITTLVPDQWFQVFKDNSVLSILLVLCISVPMYVCATGSIPIAVALMLKGLTPGAALVLLMAGPACNVASLLVINRVMGRRTLLLYLLAIVGGAVAFGLGIDYLLPRLWFTSGLVMQAGCCAEDSFSAFHIVCAAALILLLMNAMLRQDCHDECQECEAPGMSEMSCPSCHTTIFHVTGMNCSHCAANVERAIRSIEGVEDVSVSLSEGSARITGDFDEEAARKAIASLGYGVSL